MPSQTNTILSFGSFRRPPPDSSQPRKKQQVPVRAFLVKLLVQGKWPRLGLHGCCSVFVPAISGISGISSVAAVTASPVQRGCSR